MIKFAQQKGATTIRGDDLDKNFSKVQPKISSQYGLQADDSGWELEIFPAFPENQTEPCCLTFVNGDMNWLPVSLLQDDIPPIEPTSNAPYNPAPRDPDEPFEPPTGLGFPQMSMFWSENKNSEIVNFAAFMEAHGQGDEPRYDILVTALQVILNAYSEEDTEGYTNFGVKTIQRCDGKTMKVFGSDWK